MKPCVFGIDDAHWIDPDSWLFLLDLMREPNAILILTTRPLERIDKKPPALVEILNHVHTKVITLEGLNSDEVVDLVRQLLGVDSIPEELKDIVVKRSHGVPLWCEELVETMLELEYLKVVDDNTLGESAGYELKDDDGEVVTKKKAILNMKGGKVNSAIQSSDIPIPDSVTGMVLARIDHMSPSEQMTLKCAAIAGTAFPRNMLQAIIPNCNPDTFNNALNDLARAGFVECTVAAKVRAELFVEKEEETRLSKQHSEVNLNCGCLEKYSHLITKPRLSADLPHKHVHLASYPPVEECKNLQFVHNYVQETAYNLWTETQRKTLHEAAAHFLENQAHKCRNCGGGDFMGGNSKKKNISRSIYTRHVSGRLHRRHSSTPDNRASISVDEVGKTKQKINRKVSGGSGDAQQCDGDEKRKPSVNIMLDVDMEECHCDEVLAYVYPQLVRHWRAAGNLKNTMIYLIQEASAAVATYNNMEALSLLQEAREIMEADEVVATNQEKGRLESLVGQVSFLAVVTHACINLKLMLMQTLYQMGQVEDSMTHFYNALQLLESSLPRTIVGGSFALLYHSIKQLIYLKFPPNAAQRKEPFLDRARCLAHIGHAYRLQNKNVMSFMTVLKRLNAAEKAQDHHLHEVRETIG